MTFVTPNGGLQLTVRARVCQARIDLYTNTTLPLQGILVYNTGLEMCTRTYVKLVSHKTRGIKTDLLVKMLRLFLYTKVTS